MRLSQKTTEKEVLKGEKKKLKGNGGIVDGRHGDTAKRGDDWERAANGSGRRTARYAEIKTRG